MENKRAWYDKHGDNDGDDLNMTFGDYSFEDAEMLFEDLLKKDPMELFRELFGDEDCFRDEFDTGVPPDVPRQKKAAAKKSPNKSTTCEGKPNTEASSYERTELKGQMQNIPTQTEETNSHRNNRPIINESITNQRPLSVDPKVTTSSSDSTRAVPTSKIRSEAHAQSRTTPVSHVPQKQTTDTSPSTADTHMPQRSHSSNSNRIGGKTSISPDCASNSRSQQLHPEAIIEPRSSSAANQGSWFMRLLSFYGSRCGSSKSPD